MNRSGAGPGGSAARSARSADRAGIGRRASTSATIVAGSERGRGKRQTRDEESIADRGSQTTGLFVMKPKKSTHRQLLPV